jgi:hypothetical protein
LVGGVGGDAYGHRVAGMPAIMVRGDGGV